MFIVPLSELLCLDALCEGCDTSHEFARTAKLLSQLASSICVRVCISQGTYLIDLCLGEHAMV